MELIILAAIGVIGTALIGVRTGISLFNARKREIKAREDLEEAEKKGALPPSLYPRVNLDLCIGSGTCAEVCPEYDVLAVLDGKDADREHIGLLMAGATD